MKIACLALAGLVGCAPPRIVAALRYDELPPADRAAESPEDERPPIAAGHDPMQCAAPVAVTVAGGLKLVVIERHAYPTVMVRLNIVPTVLARTGPDAMRLQLLGQTFLPDGDMSDDASGACSDSSCAVDAWGAAADSARVVDRLARAVSRSLEASADFRRRFTAATRAVDAMARFPTRVVSLNAFAASFGRPLYGPGHLPDAVGLDELTRLRDVVIRPDQATLVVAGDITPEQAQAEVQASFASWKSAAAPAPRAPDPAAPSSGPALVYVKGFGPTQSAIAVTVRGPSRDSPDAPAFAIAAHLLGGGMGSLAFRSMRDEMGAAYRVGADLGWTSNGSLLTLSGFVETSTTLEAVGALLRVVRTFARAGASEADVARARAALRARALRDQTSNVTLARSLSGGLVAGGSLDACSFARRCQDVTPADVLRVASAYLADRALHVVVVAPDDALVDDLGRLGLGEPRRRDVYGYDVHAPSEGPP